MDFIRPKVIVLSRNYSTGLGVIRSLGKVGYSVDLVASVKKRGSSIIASSSKYVEHALEVLSSKIQGDDGQDIIKVLQDYPHDSGEKMILFPTDDFTASVIDQNRIVLKPYYLMPYLKESDNTITEMMSKKFQSSLAESVGLFIPKEWTVSLRETIDIPNDIIYPCFVKPLQSISGSKNEMKKCMDKKQLLSHLKSMKSFYEERDILIQEYLDIHKEYDLSGICSDQNVYIPALIEKTRIAQHERGVTMTGKMVPVDVLGETKLKIVELLKRLRYVGMFDMELNLCDGKIYFNEINFRSGGPSFAYFLNGINIPDLCVKELCGIDSISEWKSLSGFGKTFVYEKVAWEDYIHGYMTKKELKCCLRDADFTLLKTSDDSKPGDHFAKRIRLSAIKQRMKKVIG